MPGLKTPAKRRGGRPTKYRPEFCDLLLEHMKRGMSFESFGAEKGVGVSKETLYTWLEKHREFLDARKRGFPYLESFYIKTGQSIATGQMRRVSAEEPMLDGQGRPIRDPKTGEILLRREYAAATPNATAWIFLCKNICGWRDKRDINVGGQPGNPVTVARREQTKAEKLAELARLSAARQACGDD